MKLSTKGRYGLRALIDLAANSDTEAVSIQSIAARQGISESYLEQLMRLLRKAELVKSVRGAGGGYVLARSAEQISVGDILRALEGNLDAVTCTAGNSENSCEGADFCVTRFVWQRINESITAAVDSIMLSQLAAESKQIRNRGAEPQQVCENEKGKGESV